MADSGFVLSLLLVCLRRSRNMCFIKLQIRRQSLQIIRP